MRIRRNLVLAAPSAPDQHRRRAALTPDTVFPLASLTKPLTATALMAQFARYGALVATPGRVAEYANLGYGLLGEFVAIHTRRGFAEAMVNGDIFIAALPGRLPARDLAGGDTPQLLLKLVRSGDRLDGAVVAYASPARLDYLLPFAILLRRED